MQADRVASRRLPFVFVFLVGVSGVGGCDAPSGTAPTASKPGPVKVSKNVTKRAEGKAEAKPKSKPKPSAAPAERAEVKPRSAPSKQAEATPRSTPPTQAEGPPRSGQGAPTLGLAPLPGSSGEDGLVGPFSHANLSVYLVVRNNTTDPAFITLAEGTARGDVVVRERDNAAIGSLWIDNRSDAPLFLHEGDRFKGGFQDRIVVASLVVPPHSESVEVASLCIEKSRWSEGDATGAFEIASSTALAPKSVRLAAKVERDQMQVWRNVDLTKAAYADRFGAARLTSSLNEALDAPSSQRAAADYEGALGSAALRYGNAVGAVFIVGDRIEEVDIYPGPSLFRKLYPRLLRSYAMDAAATDDSRAEPPRRAAVSEFLVATEEGNGERLDQHNRLETHDLGSRWFLRTQYQGEVVHEQFMAKGG